MSRSFHNLRSPQSAVWWLWLLCPMGGCAGPAPALFPPVPCRIDADDSGRTERAYDLDGDASPDYWEIASPEGVVTRLRFRAGSDGQPHNDELVLDEMSPDDCSHLLIILDSVPYAMVRDLWDRGRFRLFHPPRPVISPFPVMTDTALAEFFGCAPCPGVESAFYDGRRLTNGYFTYANEVNTPWLAYVDYHLSPVAHSVAYLDPEAWFDHELRRIQELFVPSAPRLFVAYAVGPSSLGANEGRDGHQAGLIRLDRFCQWVAHATRGRARITLMSDHGHNLVRSRRIPLPELLGRAGYRVGARLEKPGDVVVPEFGIVTCAAIHTREPDRVARDVVGFEGIELAAYRDAQDRVVVVGRAGEAVISRKGDAFGYEATAGDPLELSAVIRGIKEKGLAGEAGCIDDRALFEATIDHRYPDAVARLWRAFHGLVEHTPDVLVSVEDGYHCGSAFMSDVVDLAAAHGNLGPMSSTAFVMSMAGALPPVVRMESLRSELVELGVPLPGMEQSTAPTQPAANP